MNNQPRKKLRKLVANRHTIKAQKGRDPVIDPATCEEFLRQGCKADCFQEINVLVAAVREGVPADIEAWPPTAPIAQHLQQLSKQLSERQALVKSAAHWAVEAWAEALHRHTPAPAPAPFFSTLRMEVLVRARDLPQAEWRLWGETPGTLDLPHEHDIGVRPKGVDYTNLKLWAQSFESPERISYVDLSRLALSDPYLEYLSIFTELRALALPSTPITGEGFSYLEALPLTQVALSNCNMLSDQGLASIARLRRLRRLDLSYCTAITARGLRTLQQVPHLRVLYLQGCTALQEDALEVLALFPELRTLDLSQTAITGLGFLNFRNNQALKILELNGCLRLSDDNVAHLLHLNALETLSLGNTVISDRALDYLASLPRLRRLHLHDCRNVCDAKIEGLRAQTPIAVFTTPATRPPIILGI